MKKQNMKKLLTGVLGTVLMVSTLLGAYPDERIGQKNHSLDQVSAEEYWPDGVGISAGATATVIDMNNGVVLYDNNGEEAHYPASITKLMTALVAVENSTMDEVVTFSETAVYENEGDTSHIARDVGEQMTMEQCLYGMLLESANECAYAIAEHVGGGDYNKFIEMMNQKAQELGCVNTHFANSNGLHDDNHYTCSYDMALISAAAYKEPEVAKISSTRQYIIPPTNKHTDPTVLNNGHAMISNHRTSKYLYEYAIGGKTGFTDQALHTMVTYAQKDGLLLCCVVMNEADKTGQYGDTQNLLNYCFDNFVEYDLQENVDLGNQVDTGPLGQNLDLLKVGEGKIVLPKTAELKDATNAISASDGSDKSVAGKITYTYAGHEVGGANLLYTENSIKKYPFHNVAPEDGGSKVKYYRVDFRLIIGLILLILVILLAFVFILHYVRKHKRRKPTKLPRNRHHERPKYTVIRRKKHRHRRR